MFQKWNKITANSVFMHGRTDFMGISKRVTVNAKITEEESNKLNRLAERENISITALIRLLVNGVLNGDIVVEKGEIKSCPTTDEMGVSAFSNEDFEENLRYKELRLDRLVKAFEDNCYPDNIIRQQIEVIVSQIRENGKFSQRKCNSDWGC